MQISFNWLKEFIALEVTAHELAERMTMLGLEIEAITEPGKEISEVYVGQIIDIQPHPDADKLVICKTDVGDSEPLQIVCGATNMKVGDKIPTAVKGATLPGGFTIGKRKMRGVESCGMMCSTRELNLGEDHSGLMILPQDTPLGADIRKLLGLDDIVFEIEVTPNRGDWASMIGVARELAAFYGLELQLPKVEINESGEEAGSCASVSIEEENLCPRYAGRILRNVTVKPSPPWLCARLMAAGQRPINNIVDITNYILLETGHPLHAFDYEKLAENRIVVRRAQQGESITTLDGESRKLTEDMLVIADAKQAQAVAGVMGGADSEVDTQTKDILLESAYFNPRSVRATARGLGLVTEAAQHFQRGADPEIVVYAINRAATLMQELADAEVAPGILDEYPKRQEGKEIKLRYARSTQLLGVDIEPKKQQTILSDLGFVSQQSEEDFCVVLTPSWRHDVNHETDLIEEVARHYGYDDIPTTMPPIRQSDRVFAPVEKKIRALRRFLAAQGLTEIVNWSFGNGENEKKSGMTDQTEHMVMLQNPLSENYPGMRTTLLPGLYATASYNHKRGARSIQLFEMGPVYHAVDEKELPEEPFYLGIVLSGIAPEHWSEAERPVDFHDIKGFMDTVLGHLGYAVTLKQLSNSAFQEGQGAIVKIKKRQIGYIGKTALAAAKSYDLPESVFVLELNLSKLFERPMPPAQFKDIPQFPASLRDLAVVVDLSISAAELTSVIKNAGGPLLKSIDVFDVYRGNPLPENKKSIAFNLVFQSPDRTLKDKDTQKAIEKIIKKLQQQHGAELR
ncbi:MAG: phenylalanine--tRNA ligase subunit beta [Candidatus Hydrogenedentes bacterium]|nr:phenylalanine--tRNA ligase subunit beta [Candidatus Hydrogenedentota bacterium]